MVGFDVKLSFLFLFIFAAIDANEEKSKVTELQAQCFILRKQVEQMEEFLADYGLIWVGDSDEEDDSQQKQPIVVPLSSRVTSYWNQGRFINFRLKVFEISYFQTLQLVISLLISTFSSKISRS